MRGGEDAHVLKSDCIHTVHLFLKIYCGMYRTDFWTLWEKTRVGCFKRTASKHVYYLG